MMFNRCDWVTIPAGYSAESAQMMEGDRVVGIVFDFMPLKHNLEDAETFPGAEVHVVDNQAGFTIGTVRVPVSELAFIKSRDSVPPQRLATYESHWVPRGLRLGLV
jgi:hypothetical protein